MRYLPCGLALCALVLTGCEQGGKSPRLALNREEAVQTENADLAPPPIPPVARQAASKVPADFRYQGRTIEQWARELRSTDVERLRRAADALRVIGPAGRPFLVQGLQSHAPETRRVCLEYLTVGDLRVYGDQGKQILVNLTGDAHDCRIRERASLYLVHWTSAIPALP